MPSAGGRLERARGIPRVRCAVAGRPRWRALNTGRDYSLTEESPP